jgi:hypothetical protein
LRHGLWEVLEGLWATEDHPLGGKRQLRKVMVRTPELLEVREDGLRTLRKRRHPLTRGHWCGWTPSGYRGARGTGGPRL